MYIENVFYFIISKLLEMNINCMVEEIILWEIMEVDMIS